MSTPRYSGLEDGEVVKGEILSGEVVRSGPWGVYFQVEDGSVGFIDAIELNWSPFVREEDIPEVGTHLRAIVQDVFDVAASQGHTFIASVRMLRPEDDPWHTNNVYSVGRRLPARVIKIGQNFLLAQLPSGAVAFVSSAPHEIGVGMELELQITGVDADAETVAATVVPSMNTGMRDRDE